MKLCLSYRQNENLLNIADEIKLNYNMQLQFIKYFNKYNGKTFIIDVPKDVKIDIESAKRWKIITMNKIVFCVSDIEQAKILKENDIKFYLSYGITSFYELNALKEFGVSYIILNAPLFFMMDKVKNIDIPIRLDPVNWKHDFLDRDNGIHGTWVRPEDLKLYDNYIDMIEFNNCDINRESALYRIYFEQKQYPGALEELFLNINIDGMNRFIIPELGEIRLNCGQKCEINGLCHSCDLAMEFSDTEKLKQFME